MRPTKRNRRAVVLVQVLAGLAVLAGLLVLLTHLAAQHHRDHKAERVRIAAAALAESGVAYVSAHAGKLDLPDDGSPLEMDAAAITPEGMTASLNVVRVEEDGKPVLRVRGIATSGAYSAVKDITLSADSG